jgi:hypothetical protein
MATKRNVFWPDVSTLENAAWATKQGVWAAAFVAVVTGIVSSTALFLHKPILGVGGSGLVDAAIFAAVACGIHKNSRFAAVSGLVIYVVERLYMLKSAGSHGAGGSVMVVFLTLAFLTAVRGTFAYRRLTPPIERAANAPAPIAH